MGKSLAQRFLGRQVPFSFRIFDKVLDFGTELLLLVELAVEEPFSNDRRATEID